MKFSNAPEGLGMSFYTFSNTSHALTVQVYIATVLHEYIGSFQAFRGFRTADK